MCLCILSSNVSYDLAKSAFSQLRKTRMLEPNYILEKYDSQKMIAEELSKSIYLPQKRDGTFRKYRFPKIRSNNIVTAAKQIYADGKSIRILLTDINSEFEARNFFVKNIPGLGLKESSHFLRDVQFSSTLAIIDVHIISFLQELELVSFDKKIITTKDYLNLEKILQKIAEINDLNLSILDNAIWYYMRYRSNS